MEFNPSWPLSRWCCPLVLLTISTIGSTVGIVKHDLQQHYVIYINNSPRVVTVKKAHIPLQTANNISTLFSEYQINASRKQICDHMSIPTVEKIAKICSIYPNEYRYSIFITVFVGINSMKPPIKAYLTKINVHVLHSDMLFSDNNLARFYETALIIWGRCLQRDKFIFSNEDY